MQSNLGRPIGVLHRLLKTPRMVMSHLTSNTLTSFTDQCCSSVDPHCLPVSNDICRSARNVLQRELPRDKYMEELQELEEKCCVARFAHKSPCKPYQAKKVQCKPPPMPFESMWLPPCQPACQPFCKDNLPRFDDMYYRASNKCRCFQRTWVECPPKRLRLKKICCLNAIKPPEVIYRPREECPRVACEMDHERMRRICGHAELRRCCRTVAPCCPPARCPPSCLRHRRPSCCEKLRAPFPSYSETRKPWRRPDKKKECLCRDISQCDVIAYARRHHMYGKKPL